MPKSGFRRNHKVIGDILKNDAGGRAAVTAARDALQASMGDEARPLEYETDRFVAAVQIPADIQAKHGTANRAAQGNA